MKFIHVLLSLFPKSNTLIIAEKKIQTATAYFASRNSLPNALIKNKAPAAAKKMVAFNITWNNLWPSLPCACAIAVTSQTKPTSGALNKNEKQQDSSIVSLPELKIPDPISAMQNPLNNPFKSDAINHIAAKMKNIFIDLLIFKSTLYFKV